MLSNAHAINCSKIYINVNKTRFVLLAEPATVASVAVVIPATCRVKGYTRLVGKYVTGRRKRFPPHKVFIFLIRITSRVDLAMSVCPDECWDLGNYYYVYAMPNSRFHFAISADSCVHKGHFANSATHESWLWIQPQSVKWWQLSSGNSIQLSELPDRYKYINTPYI